MMVRLPDYRAIWRRLGRRLRRVATMLALACVAIAGIAGGFALRSCMAPDERTQATTARRSLRDPLHTPAGEYTWTELPTAEFPIPPYARYLAGVRIVVDPGHGGRAYKQGWKVGPTGLREAQVNLRVALMLKEFLAAVHADVILTRERDEFLAKSESDDLARRAALANQRRADLFLSIHHNAAGRPEANRTEVYYHGTPDHSPASLDAARYLVSGLNQALRLEQHLPCPLLSDTNRVASGGFAVLRLSDVPAVLVESSFFTNPLEEQKLRDGAYNRREAYGLFVGLARWAHAGLPRVSLLEPADARAGRGDVLVVELADGLSDRALDQGHAKIRFDSILVKLDGAALAGEVDQLRRRLYVPVPGDARVGAHELYVNFATITGQHVLHPRLGFEVVGR